MDHQDQTNPEEEVKPEEQLKKENATNDYAGFFDNIAAIHGLPCLILLKIEADEERGWVARLQSASNSLDGMALLFKKQKLDKPNYFG